MVLIRPYEPRDMDAVIDAVHTVYMEYGFGWEPDGYHRDLFDIPGHYVDTGGGFWVGELDGGVVGCGGLLAFKTVPGEVGTLAEHEGQVRVCGCDCELMRLYVHPKGRRKGVGTALFEEICDEARGRGRSRMEIWSDKNLKDAHRMYDRYGAVTIGERLCPPPDVAPEWGMLLKL